MKKERQVELLFNEFGGVMTTKELMQKGISHYYIRKMVANGVIEPLKRGMYKLSQSTVDELVEVTKMIPKGVLCLFSAASIHELSTFVPFQYHIAIPRKDKIKLPNYPPIKLYYWSSPLLTLGVEQIEKDGNLISVYDLEKTVCDFFKFKNKTGFETSKEVLKTYLKRKDRDLGRLVKYSKTLKVHYIMEQYLKILI